MGTRNVMGDGKSKKITIARSGDNVAPRKVDPDSGKAERSFAQPNPNIEHDTPQPKAHASAEDAVRALEENSTQGRSYREEQGDDAGNDGSGE